LPNGEGSAIFDVPNVEGSTVPWSALLFPEGDGEGVALVPNGVDDVDTPKVSQFSPNGIVLLFPENGVVVDFIHIFQLF